MRANRTVAGGTLALAVLLLVGAGAAAADELSDLRAQIAVLRLKMDELAQFAPGTTGGAAYGTAAAPGAGLVGGSFARSFLIPGTNTSIRIGRHVDETVDYFIQNGTASTTVGVDGNLGTQALDVHGQIVPGYKTGYVVPVQVNHPRGKRDLPRVGAGVAFNVETRTPTALGEADT
jgi:hypothetical protein